MLTFETNAFEIGHATRGPQIKKVVFRTGGDGLAFVPIVIHIESHTSGVGFTASCAILDNPAISIAKQTRWIASDQFIARGFFEMELASIASSLCEVLDRFL